MVKINILHLAESTKGGGAESVFRDTILALKKNDLHNAHFVACIKQKHDLIDVDIDFGINNQSLLSQVFSIKNYQTLKKGLNFIKPQIVHIQNYGNLSPSILKALFEYRNESKFHVYIVQTVHTFEYVCSHYAAFDYRKNRRCIDCAGSGYKFKIFYRGCSRLGYLHSWAKGITSLIASYYIKKGLIDKWLTPSEFLKEQMLVGQKTPNDIEVVRNPISEAYLKTKFVPDVDIPRVFEVVYFGRFSEEKNLESILNAVKILLDTGISVKLTLIGRGDIKDSLVEMSRNLAIHNHIEFIDFLETGELASRLQKAHIFVLASKCFETASLVINEAVLCGLVPIVSGHGAMLETLQILGVGLSFDCNQPSTLAKAVIQVTSNFSFYNKQLNSAFGTIADNYNSTKFINKLKDLYEQNTN